jgi:hypothetical protein
MNEVINNQVITINIPINVLANLRQTAAEIADLCREDFLLSLAQFNVSPFQYSAIEILQEAGYDTVDC